MVAGTGSFDKFTIPRVAQLTLRSNQFNLRTIRYSEKEIALIAEDDTYHTLFFTLADKFGENGLIAAVILQKTDPVTLFIDTWIMSCRVLKRGMEDFTLNAIVEKAAAGGFKTIVGEYIPTPKNGLVKNHYANLGFAQKGNLWTLSVTDYIRKEYFIKKNHE
jgi:FkbH-like protein